eukprot:gene5482-6036_t
MESDCPPTPIPRLFEFHVQEVANSSSLLISIQYEGKEHWEVTHSMEDCRVFLEEALGKGILDDEKKNIPETITPTLMEAYLRSIMKKFSPDNSSTTTMDTEPADQIDVIWRDSLLHHFFEPNSCRTRYNPLALAKIDLLEKKLQALSDEVRRYDERLEVMERSNLKLTSVLQTLLRNRQASTTSTKPPIHQSVPSPSAPVVNEIVPSEREEGIAGNKNDCEGSISDLSAHSNTGDSPRPSAPPALSLPISQPDVLIGIGETNELADFFKDDSQQPDVAWESLEENADTPLEKEEEFDPQTCLSPAMLTNVSLISNENWHARDSRKGQEQAVDEIIQAVQPRDAQLIYRQSAIAFLKKQIKTALNTLSFDVGMYELRCFLPGDPIRLTAIVPQSQAGDWFSLLADRLKVVMESSQRLQRMISGGDMGEDKSIGEGGTFRHVIRIVNLLPESTSAMRAGDSTGGAYKVCCTIDSVEVEISINNRVDLCLNSLLENLDCKIGKGHLFKRTILLIRAWWVYETSMYAEVNIKHYLSDHSLAVMIMMIFNLYFRFIESPLQALFLFLKEFASCYSENAIITIQGIINLGDSNETKVDNNQNTFQRAQKYHLITPEMQEKYWYLYNVHEQIPAETSSSGPAKPTSPITRHRLLLNSMARAFSRSFERQHFNILNPFTHGNMIQSKFSFRRAGLINRTFSLALDRLMTQILKIPTAVIEGDGQIEQAESNEESDDSNVIRGFFPYVINRFSNEARVDTMSQQVALIGFDGQFVNSPTAEASASSTESDRLQGDENIFLEGVHYANFIVESIVSEEAIITFCKDLLISKGPQPVGEVGKLLSQATTIPQFSHRLREKFGGLKKFLEKCVDVFVFSNDHPFNPHVLLRKTISDENLELIDRGIFPVHLLSRYTRVSASKKEKRSNPPSTPSGSVNSSPNQHDMACHPYSPPVSTPPNILSAGGPVGFGGSFGGGSSNNSAASSVSSLTRETSYMGVGPSGLPIGAVNNPLSGGNIYGGVGGHDGGGNMPYISRSAPKGPIVARPYYPNRSNNTSGAYNAPVVSSGYPYTAGNRNDVSGVGSGGMLMRQPWRGNSSSGNLTSGMGTSSSYPTVHNDFNANYGGMAYDTMANAGMGAISGGVRGYDRGNSGYYGGPTASSANYFAGDDLDDYNAQGNSGAGYNASSGYNETYLPSLRNSRTNGGLSGLGNSNEVYASFGNQSQPQSTSGGLVGLGNPNEVYASFGNNNQPQSTFRGESGGARLMGDGSIMMGGGGSSSYLSEGSDHLLGRNSLLPPGLGGGSNKTITTPYGGGGRVDHSNSASGNDNASFVDGAGNVYHGGNIGSVGSGKAGGQSFFDPYSAPY